MLKLNATLHDTLVMSEQQVSQNANEQARQNDTASKGKGTSSFAVLFKQMSHTLYLWTD
jgi:hypothetical protein